MPVSMLAVGAGQDADMIHTVLEDTHLQQPGKHTVPRVTSRYIDGQGRTKQRWHGLRSMGHRLAWMACSVH